MADQKEPPMTGIESDLYHAMRLAFAGTDKDRQMYLRRLARRYRTERPELSANLYDLVKKYGDKTSILRSQ